MLLCALMTIVNSLRYRSRGPSAFLLSAAFLVSGIEIYFYRDEYPQGALIAGGVVIFLLLAADVIVRSRDAEAKRRGHK
jgi:hypothetical protein